MLHIRIWKESVGIWVCIKLPLLSQVGREQEREGAKWIERKEGSAGKRDCQTRKSKKRERKDNQVSCSSSFNPLALYFLFAFMPPPLISLLVLMFFLGVCIFPVCIAVVSFIVSHWVGWINRTCPKIFLRRFLQHYILVYLKMLYIVSS